MFVAIDKFEMQGILLVKFIKYFLWLLVFLNSDRLSFKAFKNAFDDGTVEENPSLKGSMPLWSSEN